MQASEQIESRAGSSRLESYFVKYSDVPREVPDYEERADRAIREGLKGCVAG